MPEKIVDKRKAEYIAYYSKPLRDQVSRTNSPSERMDLFGRARMREEEASNLIDIFRFMGGNDTINKYYRSVLSNTYDSDNISLAGKLSSQIQLTPEEKFEAYIENKYTPQDSDSYLLRAIDEVGMYIANRYFLQKTPSAITIPLSAETSTTETSNQAIEGAMKSAIANAHGIFRTTLFPDVFNHDYALSELTGHVNSYTLTFGVVPTRSTIKTTIEVPIRFGREDTQQEALDEGARGIPYATLTIGNEREIVTDKGSLLSWEGYR